MVNRRATQQKRNKERARQEKRRRKAERRLELKGQRAAADSSPPGERDDDLAHIRPGPQPPADD